MNTAALDELVTRARDAARVPMAWISVFDGRAEKLVAKSGVAIDELPRAHSIAFAATALREPLFVADLCASGFESHWLVAAGPRARSIGIVPLVSSEAIVLGTLTVLDSVPRVLDPRSRTALCNLGSLAIAHLQARRDRDIEEALMREARLTRVTRDKERLDLALAGSGLALWDWDVAAARVYFNASWSVLLGAAGGESIHAPDAVAAWNHPDDTGVYAAAMGNALKGVSEEFDCEYRVRNAGGDWIWIHSRGKVTQRDGAGRALRMTGTSEDITKRKRAEERAEYLATRDALTGLPNRMLLHDRLRRAVINAARSRVGFAFMFIDLDRFKAVNDTLGHQAGDELLKQVAGRLNACVRASDTLARLGGDEFAVILESVRDDDEGPRQVAEKMVAALAVPVPVNGQPLAISCSIGIAMYPGDARDAAAVMKCADVAMYYAKERGRNNYQFFSAPMNARAEERLALENYLRIALKRDELTLHYQPRLKLADGTLAAVEALVRWQHPRRGLLLPESFLGAAEESGLVVPLGEWVMEHACAQAGAWRDAKGAPLRLSIKVSAAQLEQGDRFMRALEASIAASGIDPAAIELSLREEALVGDESSATLARLGKLGVHIAIADFGMAHIPLAKLATLPVGSVAIAPALAQGAASVPGTETVVRAIVAMAHALGLTVVAPAVETEAQRAALAALGCDECQGIHESPPLVPADLAAKYLAPRR